MNVINCSDAEKNNNISQFYIIDDVKSRERPKIGRDHQLGEKGEWGSLGEFLAPYLISIIPTTIPLPLIPGLIQRFLLSLLLVS